MPAPTERKTSLTSKIKARVDALKATLKEASPQVIKEQKHLDEGSAERAYWHYGYLSALEDVLRQLRGEN
jgi:hypothetical protein